MNTDNEGYPSNGAGWVLRVRSGDMTPSDQRRLREWRANKRNDRDYLQADRVWEISGALAQHPAIRAELSRLRRDGLNGLPSIGAVMPSAIRAVMPSAIRAAMPRSVRAAMPLAMRGGLTLAASALFAVIAGMLWLGFSETEWHETAVGKQSAFALPDGSSVTINTDTLVGVRFTSTQRRLSLERGEALFDVARDTARPFVVRVRNGEVRALGTRFNILVQPDRVTVTMLEGTAEVTLRGGRSVARAEPLAAGESIAFGRNGGFQAADPTAASLPRIKGWQRHMLHFVAQPAAAAVLDHNRYAAKPIVLESTASGQELITGQFEIGDTEAFAVSIAENIGAEVVIEADRIVLR